MTTISFTCDPDPLQLKKFNIFLGLNGSGKSSFIKQIVQQWLPRTNSDMDDLVWHNHPTAADDRFKKMGKAIRIIDDNGEAHLIETVDEDFLRCFQVLVSDQSIPNTDLGVFLVTKVSQGQSHVKELAVDEYGFIDQWPDHLFDLGIDLLIRMTESAIDRKMSEGGSE